MARYEEYEYERVKADAQRKADESGHDYGVERHAFGYHCFMLPRRENRYGHELRCEVVHCSTLAKCQPGHGPTRD